MFKMEAKRLPESPRFAKMPKFKIGPWSPCGADISG